VSLSAAAGRAGVGALLPVVTKKIPRRVRKAMQELVPRLGDRGEGCLAWARAARRTALRAGLVSCGDLPAAIETVLGGPSTPAATLASDDARDLVRFWISRDVVGVRHDLGFG
jgi:hypothetical protein